MRLMRARNLAFLASAPWRNVQGVQSATMNAGAASQTAAVVLPTAARFAIAGLSGMSAWMFIHPLDVSKTRMQLMGKQDSAEKVSALDILRELVRNEGFFSLYGGLSAALARQATYTTLRLGLYDVFRDLFMAGRTDPLEKLLLRLFVVGPLAGGIAAFASCPVEVALVRMQADGRQPPALRRNYSNVGDALIKIAQGEGISAWWKGAGATVIRAMVVSVTQVSTQDQASSSLSPYLQGFPLQLAAGIIAAVVFTTVSMPLDTVKTRLQQASKGDKATSHNAFQAMRDIARSEGTLSLWKGFGPYFASKGILTVLLFLIKAQYERLAKGYYAGHLPHKTQ